MNIAQFIVVLSVVRDRCRFPIVVPIIVRILVEDDRDKDRDDDENRRRS